MSLGLKQMDVAELHPSGQELSLGDDHFLRALVAEHGSPLLLLDCNRVREQYLGLVAALPGVDLHYAMKALTHPAVIGALHQAGCLFDISTTGEIGLLRSLSIRADKVVHTHPIKRDRDIQDALDFGCRIFVVDNPDEMMKFIPYRDRVSLLLRVGFRNPRAVVDLAKKFGCDPDDAFGLLELAKNLGLDLSGLSFHVGSQCGTPEAHVGAVEACCVLIERARQNGLTPIRVLDIGGGFPASYQVEEMGTEEFCTPIRDALRRVPAGVRVIAEPGRHLVASAITGVTAVIGKARRGDALWYYLDDGVYGSFSGKIYDGARYPLKAISGSGAGLGDKHHRSVLAGPTCDSIDLVAEDLMLPELEIGDLIVSSSMGAYTAASASEFNSIPKAKILVFGGPPPRGLRAESSSR